MKPIRKNPARRATKLNARSGRGAVASAPAVAVVMGSSSDRAIVRHCASTLAKLGIRHETLVLSSHRDPRRTAAFADEAAARGYRVIIACAGMSAHLAGALAARTHLPVIGVPLDAGALKGVDAFVSTLQMPAGVPVATMSIGKAGCINAALLAARMLALTDDALVERVGAFNKLKRSSRASNRSRRKR